MTFSKVTRQASIEHLKTEILDVLIIGGGITGAGVALQASAAGMKTGLIESQDFAEGTSSRSTKLVHGGIRYLKQFDVEVVAETVQERAVVQRIAPHIPRADPMLLPIFDEPMATFNLFSLKVAMDLYDHLAWITASPASNYLLTKEEVLEREPQLQSEGLLGGGVYLDFSNNDARLVIENIKQAAADGGWLVNRVEAVGFTLDDQGQITGAKAKDLLTDETFEIQARVVINTGGPWSDEIRQLGQRKPVTPQIRPTKGVHLVVDKSRLNVPQPTYLDTGKGDGRMIFIIPREQKTYFGTTDTDYHGALAHPTVTQADVDYLLEIVNSRYPQAHLTLADIEASWAGLRPLIASNSSSDYIGGTSNKVSQANFEELLEAFAGYQRGEVARTEVEALVQNLGKGASASLPGPSTLSRGSHLFRNARGLITLAGGKITDYRKMAEGALKMIQVVLKQEFQREYQLIDSTAYSVSGGKLDPTQVDEALEDVALKGLAFGLTIEESRELAHLYGSNAEAVYELSSSHQQIPGLTLGESLSLVYALTAEMVLTPADYLVRRTDDLYFKRESLARIKEPILTYMSEFFNWTVAEQERYRAELEQVIQESDLTSLKESLSIPSP